MEKAPFPWELVLLVVLCGGANMDASRVGRGGVLLPLGSGRRKPLGNPLVPGSHPSPGPSAWGCSLADCIHTFVSLIYVLLCLCLQ